MFKTIMKGFFKQRVGTNTLYVLFALVILLVGLNAYFIYEDFFVKAPDPIYTIGLLLASLIAILVFCVLIVSNRVSSKFSN